MTGRCGEDAVLRGGGDLVSAAKMPALTRPHHEGGCHDGYKLLSLERPTVYCSCLMGAAAYAMDQDPLDAYKAERWERLCRSRKEASRA